MKGVPVYIGLLLAARCFFPVSGVTMRRIYTLFTEEKTWNEAKAICSDQFGQLIKIKGDSEIYELKYLDEFAWSFNLSQRLPTGASFWSGHHRPLSNSSIVKFQDCESFVQNVPVSVNNRTCGTYDLNFTLTMSPCDETKMFICERYEGDCWYQPILNEQSTVSKTQLPPVYGQQAIDCAMTCRNHTGGAGEECWAFLYGKDPKVCLFFTLDDAFVLASGAAVSTTSASAFYSYESNRQPTPVSTVDFFFYIRKCFEGSLDMTIYDQYKNQAYYAETVCATTTNAMIESVSDICFCATEEQPPIPKPISSEAKADDLIKELTIAASNTSAAQRKLTSAEDDRESAVSVGYIGVGLMIATFGTLFFMDANRLIQTFRKVFCSPRSESTESTA